MTETRHTPGPWKVHEGKHHFIGKCSQEGYHIDLEVWAPEHFDANGNDHNEVCTNINDPDDARLIAAAPEMLNALRSVRTLFRPKDGLPIDVEANFRRIVQNDPVLKEVNAVLAKIES